MGRGESLTSPVGWYVPSQKYVQGTGMIWWNETTRKEVIYKLSFEGCIEVASLGVVCCRGKSMCRAGRACSRNFN